ncbi:uncharacterized protein LOC107304570 [Oryza brachyantha]|uniref:uncharacterized protein LOC107304570 n=1 Tax=Oryza brachyantha TaxID=4533 RepID=UPI001AD9C0C2|nr:uncharacterized protein LOC107304570 [Oryza brachyantha]
MKRKRKKCTLNWASPKASFRPGPLRGPTRPRRDDATLVSAISSTHFPLLPPEATAAANHSLISISPAAAAAMGRGRNRKPRNFATFRLCPRPGAADASDRVFVRVDDNPYSVPGFADDDGAAGEVDDEAPSSSETGPLPEHVRREILELGLPDDGYDYLPHLRELRPSLSSSGGGASAAFLPSRRRRHARAHFGPPLDVKAYDASRVRIASDEAAATTAAVEVTRVDNAIDPDVAKLLEEGDEPGPDPDGSESEHDDLEEDFVLVANQPDEDFVLVADNPEEEEICIAAVDHAEDALNLKDGECKGGNSASA